MPKMKNGGITMTVPGGRVHEFENNGWKVVEGVETATDIAERAEPIRRGRPPKDEDKI